MHFQLHYVEDYVEHYLKHCFATLYYFAKATELAAIENGDINGQNSVGNRIDFIIYSYCNGIN